MSATTQFSTLDEHIAHKRKGKRANRESSHLENYAMSLGSILLDLTARSLSFATPGHRCGRGYGLPVEEGIHAER